MFWKTTAWSWDDAAGNDDDYLLSDLRRTPDSAPDPDLNRITSTATTSLSNCTTSTPGLEDLTNLTWTSSRPLSSGPTNSTFSSYVSALYINNNQVLSDQDGTQRLSVSPSPLSHHTSHLGPGLAPGLGPDEQLSKQAC